jgi:anti-sigma factor RsiW
MNHNGKTTSCNIAPPDLEAFFDGNLADDDLRACIEAHLPHCPECRAQIHALTALRERLRAEVHQTEAPPYLRREVEEILKRRWRPAMVRPKVRMVAYAAAAILLVVLGFAIWENRSSRPSNLAMTPKTAYIKDHIAYVQGRDDKENITDEITALETWLMAKLDFAAQLPQWETATLLSGRPCSIQGKKVALIRYKIGGHEASLYIHPAAISDNSDGIAMDRVGNFHVATWRQHNLDYVLVAPEEVDHLCNQLAFSAFTSGASIP